MPKTSSYQRRKREIAYLRQVEDELRDLCLLLAGQINAQKLKMPLSAVGGISGDDFITPYNCGTFYMELLFHQASENV